MTFVIYSRYREVGLERHAPDRRIYRLAHCFGDRHRRRCAKRIDYRSPTALSSTKTSRGGAPSEHERFEIAGSSRLLYLLWPIVVTTRLPRGARRIWRGLGCPDRRGAWTDKAGADRHPPSFLSARISETLA